MLRNQFEAVTRLRLRSPLWTAILDAFLAADVMRRGTIGRVQFRSMARAIFDRFGNLAQTVFGAGSGSTGACGYNRPRAHQYVGKSQSCMVENGRLIPHASYTRNG